MPTILKLKLNETIVKEKKEEGENFHPKLG